MVEAFSKLPPLLSYGGLILVASILILYATGSISDILLSIPIVALVAFLLYAFMEHHFERQRERDRQAFELQQEQQRLAHEQRMAELAQSRLPSPTTDQPATNQPLTTSHQPPATWEERYLRHLMRVCGFPISTALLDLKEAGEGAVKLGLERIFTALDVPDMTRRFSPEQLATLNEAVVDREELKRESALQALSRDENKHLVLLGAPGAGKSTLVNYLTLCLAGDHLRQPHVNQSHLVEHKWALSHLDLWPVRVVLREYAAQGLPRKQGIWAFIAHELSSEGVQLAPYAPQLHQKLLDEGGLLLLDGLDEVDQAEVVRAPLKRHIEQFVRDFPKVRVVVTSRPYAYGGSWALDGFAVTRLLSFSDEQIAAFVTQWYGVMGQEDGTLGPERAKHQAEGLVDQIKRSRNLQELACQPLLLTMMVYIHRGREGGALPQRRETLYKACVDLLLKLWQRGKTVTGEEPQTLNALLGIDSEKLLGILAEVAFVAHQSQPAHELGTADIQGDLLAGMLFTRKESKATVEDIIAYVRDRAGLLVNPSGTETGVYRFPHRTFQEYLAGVHLLRHQFPYYLAKLAGKDPARWREALLLAAASQRTVPSTVWSLVAALAEDEPHARNEAVWRAFLAGQALLETELTAGADAQIKGERETRGRVRRWQAHIVTAGLLTPRDRALAGNALAVLGDTRPGVLLPDEMGLCYVPSGRFWLGDEERETRAHWNDTLDQPYWLGQYPVTVGQFRQFVTESDYTPRYSDSLKGADNWPVGWVNWYDALAFCAWLDERWRKWGWLPEGYRVTLPSEAEWEKAARGGEVVPQVAQVVTARGLVSTLSNPPATEPNDWPRRRFPWGDEDEETASGDETVYRANNKAAGIGRRCAVGSFPLGRSRVGCEALSGQVWEWTRTLYGNSYPYKPSPKTETMDSRNENSLVLRGGAYWREQNVCSVCDRHNPHYDFDDLYGFRVSVSPFLAAGL